MAGVWCETLILTSVLAQRPNLQRNACPSCISRSWNRAHLRPFEKLSVTTVQKGFLLTSTLVRSNLSAFQAHLTHGVSHKTLHAYPQHLRSGGHLYTTIRQVAPTTSFAAQNGASCQSPMACHSLPNYLAAGSMSRPRICISFFSLFVCGGATNPNQPNPSVGKYSPF